MYDEKLVDRPQIVVCNKTDMPDSNEKFEQLKSKINGPIIAISAIQKNNIRNNFV